MADKVEKVEVVTEEHVRSLEPEHLLNGLYHWTTMSERDFAACDYTAPVIFSDQEPRPPSPAAQNMQLCRNEVERRLKRHAHVEAVLAEMLPQIDAATAQYEQTMKELGYRD